MLPLKKKFLGYDKVQVDIAIKELNDEVFALRQELFTAEKKRSEIKEDEAFTGSDRTRLLNELDSLKNQLKQKEHEILVLVNQVNMQSSGDESIQKDINEYRQALTEMDRILAEKNGIIAAMEGTVARLKVQYENAMSKRSTPDLKMIEKIYMRAFLGARDIAEEAKESICGLTDRVHDELSASVRNSSTIYEDLLSAKREMETFIVQGMGHFRALEKMLAGISDVDMKTPIYIKNLEDTKVKILQDVEASLNSFDIEMEEEITFADEPASVPELDFDLPVSSASKPVYENDAAVTTPVIMAAPVSPVVAEHPANTIVESDAAVYADTNVNAVDKPVKNPADESYFLSDNVTQQDDDDFEDSYDPQEELDDMKEAIKREHMASVKADESTTESGSVSAANQAERSAGTTAKPKVNIQDILKKYSNINA